MKKVIIAILFILIKTNAQDCLTDITCLKFSTGYPYGKLVIQDSQNFDDPYVVKWNSSKVNGTPICLSSS